jgi:predicted nucleic acid-binding protein
VTTVYDTGMLIAADRNDREAWADHRARLEAGLVPLTTAPVVSQASRSPRQAQLRRFLRGCDVVPFAPDESHQVGALLARTSTSDVVDAHVAVVAARVAAIVMTSDPDDLRVLAEHTRPSFAIKTVV